MRVDPAHSGEALNPVENRPAGSTPASAARKAPPEAAVDSSQIRAASQPYVAAAIQAPLIDQQAVDQAKSLIQAGLLDTPAARERLAQALLDGGI